MLRVVTRPIKNNGTENWFVKPNRRALFHEFCLLVQQSWLRQDFPGYSPKRVYVGGECGGQVTSQNEFGSNNNCLVNIEWVEVKTIYILPPHTRPVGIEHCCCC